MKVFLPVSKETLSNEIYYGEKKLEKQNGTERGAAFVNEKRAEKIKKSDGTEADGGAVCANKKRAEKNEKPNKTRIGGQAVIEGVMMRGISSEATAVRSGDGKILIASARSETGKTAAAVKKIPLVRGVYNFAVSMLYGVGSLQKSASVSAPSADGKGEPPSRFEKWAEKTLKINAATLTMVMAVVFALAFAVGIFVILPHFLMQFIDFDIAVPEFLGGGFRNFLNGFLKNLLTGIFRIAIFLLYLVTVSRLKDIRRVFAYHGAEHKVINCYERALPLTVENARKMTVKHERCGTTFIFLVMLVSVLFFSFLGFDENLFLRVLTRVAFLPVVAGISYEVLIFSAKHDNVFFRVLRAPGMWLQRLTTREPSDDMLEVSLAAFKTVLETDRDKSFPLSSFESTVYPYSFVRDFIKEELTDYPADQAKWIIAEALNTGRAALPAVRCVSIAEFEKMKEFAAKRRTGMPLQRVFGRANFFGLDMYVDGSALVPRPETELLADEVKKYLEKLLNKKKSEPEKDVKKSGDSGLIDSEKISENGGIETRKSFIDSGAGNDRLGGAETREISVDGYGTETRKINAESAKPDGAETRKIKVLDLCAGSGAIAVALGVFFKEKIDLTASDISAEALAVAKKNAGKHGAEIKFARSDIFGNIEGRFDVIVSNPPYVRTGDIAALEREVRDFDPVTALDGGADGLDFYRAIKDGLADKLNTGGRLFLEIGEGQRAAIAEIFGESTEFVKDFCGTDRIAVVKN
jgi:uncharacterized protein YqhQ/methylase of polypeptide subunit release factors